MDFILGKESPGWRDLAGVKYMRRKRVSTTVINLYPEYILASGDLLAGLVLSLIEEYAILQRSGPDQRAYITIDEMVDALMRTYSRESIARRIKQLKEQGFIRVLSRSGDASFYVIQFDAIERKLLEIKFSKTDDARLLDRIIMYDGFEEKLRLDDAAKRARHHKHCMGKVTFFNAALKSDPPPTMKISKRPSDDMLY